VAALTATKDQSLVIYDVASLQWRRLDVDHVGAATWSPDSADIYCDQEGPEKWLRRVRVSDGHVERLIEVGTLARGHGASLALDGAPLVRIAETEIYALELTSR